MPLYSYECDCGTEFDRVLPVARCDYPQHCPECDLYAKKIISMGHGGIMRTGDSVPWVRDVARILTDGERPNPNLNSVDDLRRYYAHHPEIVPAESHPALPSNLGDVLDKRKTPSDMAAFKRERSRKAKEKLRDMRTIKVTGQAAAQPR